MLDQNSNAPAQPSPSTSQPIKLWTPNFIGGVTFLLGFPAGIVLASINWMRMNLNNKAVAHLIAGGAGAVIFVLILMLTPGTFGRSLGLVVNVGILFYLQQQMKKDLEYFKATHDVENAGQLGGCLIGLGILAIFVILVVGLSIVLAILGVPIPD